MPGVSTKAMNEHLAEIGTQVGASAHACWSATALDGTRKASG
jgi:hypothetical protein